MPSPPSHRPKGDVMTDTSPVTAGLLRPRERLCVHNNNISSLPEAYQRKRLIIQLDKRVLFKEIA